MVRQQLPGLGGHPRNISPETLLIQASETLASLNAMTTDLAFEFEGANRHKLLATQHLIVLGERLVERVMVLTQGTQTGFQS
ncbi:DUF6124 family protein [Pseudomonas sp. MIACH]|uniref:DUF6124 family protein n=1 Tax=Pseudomonas sp. MIACH TaxID=1078355 RepID=UPI00069F9871|nr:hypothetical protein [Pseudomonas sp. MIACH]